MSAIRHASSCLVICFAGFLTTAHADSLAAIVPPQVAASPPIAGTMTVNIIGVGSGKSTLDVVLSDKIKLPSLKLAEVADREKLSHANIGDQAIINVDDIRLPKTIMKLVKVTRPICAEDRLIALVIASGLLMAVAAVFTGGRPQRFLIGVDNRYSNSQVQLFLWFGVVAIVYLATVGLRIHFLGWDFVGGVGITENLLVLTGLSALSFGGAKMITAAKVDDAELKGASLPKAPAAQARLLTDMVQNDGGYADLGDFQMILIAIAAVMLFALSSFHFLGELELATAITLPDVDSTMLSAFGLGQGAYLLKKGAMKLGTG